MRYCKSLLNCVIAGLALFAVVACKGGNDAPKKVPAEINAGPEESLASSILKAKARSVIGETDLQKKNVEAWKRLRVGQGIVEDDRVRTGLESSAVLAINDGSSLAVNENTDVTINAEMLDSLSRNITVVIKKGVVYFDVQKQPRGRDFKFKTGTAAVAIRGTAGFVGDIGGQSVASLKEGRVEVSGSDGAVESITENQTVLLDRKGVAKKINLKSSGTAALAKALDSIAAAAGTAEAPAELPQEQLEKDLQEFDNSYAVRRADFEKRLRFQAAALPAQVFLPNVTLQARVNPGVVVTVLGERDTVPANGVYQHVFEWAEDAYGTKRFLATCSEGDVEIPCFMWITDYVNPAQEPADTAAVDSAAQADNAQSAADLKNLSVRVSGGRTERIHLDLPANSYRGNLKFNLAGITRAALDQIAKIEVRRKGAVVETINGNELTSLDYEIPVSVDLNRIANFEVVVTAKDGKVYRARKTYEVYCLRRNHAGNARNFVQYKTVEEEYEAIRQRGDLKEE